MPAATVNAFGEKAGAQFRAYRTRLGWKQGDVEKESARRFGEEGAIKVAQLSRIEKGGYDRVSLDDAVRLGILYGLTPNDVAQMYGLYTEHTEVSVPDAVRNLLSVLPTLPFDIQDSLLRTIRVAAVAAQQEVNERKNQHDQEVKQEGKHAS